jgi:ABC-type Co2+ transport system permease subunit
VALNRLPVPQGHASARKLPLVAVWAAAIFVLLLLSLGLHPSGALVNFIYAGLLISAAVAIVFGRAWLETVVWNLVRRWRDWRDS